MGDIKFECSRCGKHLAIDEKGAGLRVRCVDCHAELTVPTPTTHNVQRAVMKSTLSTSPHTKPSRACQLVSDLCTQFPMDEAVFMVGNAAIPEVEELVRLGDAATDACKAGFGRTRLVYTVLQRIGTQQAVSALRSELSTESWQRAQLACQALAWVESANVLSALPDLRNRRSDQSGEVVVAAAEAIKRIEGRFQKRATRPTGNIDALLNVLIPKYEAYRAGIDDAACEASEHAADALGDLGDRRALPLLLQLLASGEPAELRWKAARALGKIGDPSAVDALAEQFLQDKNGSTIARTADAIVGIAIKSGDGRAFAKLVSLLENSRVQSDGWLRDEIVRALKEVTGNDIAGDCTSWLKWLRTQSQPASTCLGHPVAPATRKPMTESAPSVTREETTKCDICGIALSLATESNSNSFIDKHVSYAIGTLRRATNNPRGVRYDQGFPGNERSESRGDWQQRLAVGPESWVVCWDCQKRIERYL